MAMTDYRQREEFEEAFHKALENYPELADTRIGLSTDGLALGKLWRSPWMMNALPDIGSLLKGRNTYTLYVNQEQNSKFFDELTPGQKTAWMMHEDHHILEYEHHQGLKLARLGLSYLTDKEFRKRFERDADIAAMKRGDPIDLLETVRKSYTSPNLPETYKRMVKEYYIPSWEEVEPYVPEDFSKKDYDELFAA